MASETIQVAVRVKPPIVAPGPNPEADALERRLASSQTCVRVVSDDHLVVGGSRPFAFDSVFHPNVHTESVFDRVVSPLINDSFLDGLNATIFAYGQTGSGKTHTMQGVTDASVARIFSVLNNTADASRRTDDSSETPNPPTTTTGAWSLKVSMIELYNEQLRDLFAVAIDSANQQQLSGEFHSGGGSTSVYSGSSSHQMSPLLAAAAVRVNPGANPNSKQQGVTIREDAQKGVVVCGHLEIPVTNEEELHEAVNIGFDQRKTASTMMNAQSSRSHALLCLSLSREVVGAASAHGRQQFSKVNFVDLAGSERIKKSVGNGNDAVAMGRVKECIAINQGLLALGEVITALCKVSQNPKVNVHIPFRSSKLTRLLQDSLSGNSRTAMIACVSSLSSDMDETLSTLKYADRAKSIVTKPVRMLLAEDGSATAASDATNELISLQRRNQELRDDLTAAHQLLAEHNLLSKLPIKGNKSGSSAKENQKPSSPLTLSPEDLNERAVDCRRSDSGNAAAQHHAQALEERVAFLFHELQKEQHHSKALENDLFRAEFDAMTSAQTRKEVEEECRVLKQKLKAKMNSGASQSETQETAELESAESGGEDDDDPQIAAERRRLQDLQSERDALVGEMTETALLGASASTARPSSTPPLSTARGTSAGSRHRENSYKDFDDSVESPAYQSHHHRDHHHHHEQQPQQQEEDPLILLQHPEEAEDDGNDDEFHEEKESLSRLVDHMTEEIDAKQRQIESLRDEYERAERAIREQEEELRHAHAERERMYTELKRAMQHLDQSGQDVQRIEMQKHQLKASYDAKLKTAEMRAQEQGKMLQEAKIRLKQREPERDRVRTLEAEVKRLSDTLREHNAKAQQSSRKAQVSHAHEIAAIQKQLKVARGDAQRQQTALIQKDREIAKQLALIDSLQKQHALQRQASNTSAIASTPRPHTSQSPRRAAGRLGSPPGRGMAVGSPNHSSAVAKSVAQERLIKEMQALNDVNQEIDIAREAQSKAQMAVEEAKRGRDAVSIQRALDGWRFHMRQLKEKIEDSTDHDEVLALQDKLAAAAARCDALNQDLPKLCAEQEAELASVNEVIDNLESRQEQHKRTIRNLQDIARDAEISLGSSPRHHDVRPGTAPNSVNHTANATAATSVNQSRETIQPDADDDDAPYQVHTAHASQDPSTKFTNKTILEMESKLFEKDEDIKALNNKVSEKSALIKQLHDLLRQQQQQINELKSSGAFSPSPAPSSPKAVPQQPSQITPVVRVSLGGQNQPSSQQQQGPMSVQRLGGSSIPQTANPPRSDYPSATRGKAPAQGGGGFGLAVTGVGYADGQQPKTTPFGRPQGARAEAEGPSSMVLASLASSRTPRGAQNQQPSGASQQPGKQLRPTFSGVPYAHRDPAITRQ